MRNSKCVLLIFGLCLVVIWAEKPACVKRKADVVVLLENSKELSKEDFEKLRKDVKTFIDNVPIGLNEGEVTIWLMEFANKVHQYGIRTKERSATFYHKRDALLHDLNNNIVYGDHNGAGPNMTLAIDTAKQSLREFRRKDAEIYVIYAGSGKNTASVKSLIRAFNPYEIKMFGIIAAPLDKWRRLDSENVQRFDGWSMVGSNDALFRIQDELNPKCSECLEPKMDMALLVEDIESYPDKEPNPRYPKNKFPIMKEVMVKALQQMNISPDTTRVALVSYGEKIYESQSFGFDNNVTKTALISHFGELKYMNAYRRNLNKALKYTLENVFTPDKTRKDATKLIVIVARNIQERKNIKIAEKIKKDGIHIFIAGFDYNSRLMPFVAGSEWFAYGDNVLVWQEGNRNYWSKTVAQRTCLIGEFQQ